MFYLSVSVTVTHICCADFLFIFKSSLGWLACFGRMQTGILFSENGDDFLLNKAFDPLGSKPIFSVLDCHLTFLFIYLKLITHNMTLYGMGC